MGPKFGLFPMQKRQKFSQKIYLNSQWFYLFCLIKLGSRINHSNLPFVCIYFQFQHLAFLWMINDLGPCIRIYETHSDWPDNAMQFCCDLKYTLIGRIVPCSFLVIFHYKVKSKVLGTHGTVELIVIQWFNCGKLKWKMTIYNSYPKVEKFLMGNKVSEDFYTPIWQTSAKVYGRSNEIKITTANVETETSAETWKFHPEKDNHYK